LKRHGIDVAVATQNLYGHIGVLGIDAIFFTIRRALMAID